MNEDIYIVAAHSNGQHEGASLRERILSLRGKQRREQVDVPGWAEALQPGEVIYVKGMTGSERDSFEDSMSVTGKNGTRAVSLKNFRAKLVARTVVDAQGRHLFTPSDIASLGELDATDLQTVFEVAQRLSGMTQSDVDELTGKSEDAPTDANTFA